MKKLTYGVMHMMVAFSVSYVLIESLAIAGTIAMVKPLVQTLACSVHEKLGKPASILPEHIGSRLFEVLNKEEVLPRVFGSTLKRLDPWLAWV